MKSFTMIEAAIWYTTQGWPILPVIPRDKRPLTRHGLKDATRDQGQIESWWTNTPDANIGIRCGDTARLVVLDIDEGGEETLADLQAIHGPLPRTLEVTTGNGGRHLYYTPQPGTRRKIKFMPGLDLCGKNGYVLAPPSVHPSGGLYRWDLPPWDLYQFMPALPDWLIALTQIKPCSPVGADSGRHTPACLRDPDIERRVIPYLDCMPPAIQGSNGNGALFAAASVLVHGFGLDKRTSVELLARFNRRCQPPWSPAELDRYAEAAYKSKTHTKPRGYLR